MADKGGQPTSLSEAKRLGSPTYKPTTGRNKGKIIAAVSKEDMKKAGFKSFGAQSLRKYLNQQKKEKKSSVKKIAAEVTRTMGKKKLDSSKPKSKSKRKTPAPVKKSPGADLSAPEITKSKRKTSAPVKASPGANLSAPKPKSRPRGSSAPLNMTGGIKPSRGTGKTDPYKYVGKGPRGKQGQAPVPTTEEKVTMAGLVIGNLGGPAAKVAIKAATKFGKPFINNLIKKIKNLTPKQQKEVLQAAEEAPTKPKAIKNTDRLLRAGGRTTRGGQPLAKDRVEPYIPKPKKPLTTGQSSAARTFDAAKQSQRIEIDPGYTGGALKKGGPIKKYNQGGKVVKRMGGGQVMSGNDLVSSLYD